MAEGKWFPSLKELFQMGSTFFFTMIAWVFFRSESVSNAQGYLQSMLIGFSFSKFKYQWSKFYIYYCINRMDYKE